MRLHLLTLPLVLLACAKSAPDVIETPTTQVPDAPPETPEQGLEKPGEVMVVCTLVGTEMRCMLPGEPAAVVLPVDPDQEVPATPHLRAD